MTSIRRLNCGWTIGKGYLLVTSIPDDPLFRYRKALDRCIEKEIGLSKGGTGVKPPDDSDFN